LIVSIVTLGVLLLWLMHALLPFNLNIPG